MSPSFVILLRLQKALFNVFIETTSASCFAGILINNSIFHLIQNLKEKADVMGD